MKEENWEFELLSDSPSGQCEFDRIGPISGSGQIGVESVFCTLEQAQLAAAAPDMLEALELIHDHARLYIGLYGPNQNVFEAVTAAINKAKGLKK